MIEIEEDLVKKNDNWEIYLVGLSELNKKNISDKLETKKYLNKDFLVRDINNESIYDEIGKYYPAVIIIELTEYHKKNNLCLDIIKYIRRKIKNNCTQILISLSEDSELIESDVIIEYDINGIIKHGDLLNENLFISIISSIKTYKVMFELGESRKKLLKAHKKLIENNQFKSNFFAKMSHEIRTPLNGIMLTTELLKEENLSVEVKEYADLIDKSTKRLLPIINNILDYSKLEVGKLKVNNKIFNIKDEFIELVNNFRLSAEYKNIELYYSLDLEMDKSLIGDVGKFRQILTNLLSNALKFTDKGKISIECKKISSNKKNELYRFSIEDSGIGIPSEKINKIFNLFEQIDSDRKGTGLGLAICKELVSLMGGNIRVESYYGVGSKFVFDLPFKVNEKIDIDEKEVKIYKPNYYNMNKILIADDDECSIKVLKKLLEKIGIASDVASDGYEVIEKLEKHDYKMILMDIEMPRLNGYEATDIIRKDMMNYTIPIIAISAYANKKNYEEALIKGLNGYVVKPIIHTELIEIIDKYIR
ncbi:ATP-binding protein [Helicovermis profundi]|uniref:Circadian input-output histidine kinase CikA n=1 Tax=Helicovermis profundi TaxID=3065157 RepID=A0AAU9E9T6_9FIRM|nr:hypothetical protein HLPR_03550 [Clostridia bacterium S502]